MADPFAYPDHMHVYWSSWAMAHALAASAHVGCIPTDHCTTFADLFRTLGDPQHAGDTYASPMLCRLWVRQAIVRAEGPWQAHAHDPWTVKAVHRALTEMRAAGITSRHILEEKQTAGGTGLSDALCAMGHLLAAYEAGLQSARLFDDADRERAAVLAVIQGQLPPTWRDVRWVTVEGGGSLLGARLDLLNAFAHRGMQVTVRIPWDAAHQTDFLWPEASLHALETRGHAALRVEYDPRCKRTKTPPEVIAMPEGPEHARWIAHRVAQWIDAGVCPDKICVATADIAGLGSQVLRQLHALGIPAAYHGSTPLHVTPMGRLVQRVLALRDEGAEREDLIDIVMALPEARADHVGAKPRGDDGTDEGALTAHVLRCAGVRSARVGGWREPLRAYARHRQQGERVQRIAQRIEKVWRALHALPDDAPLHTHLHAFSAMLLALGVIDQTPMHTTPDGAWMQDWASVQRMWCSEAHAMQATTTVMDVLTQLADAAHHMMGAQSDSFDPPDLRMWSRREVSQWLHMVLQESSVPAHGGRLGAIAVCGLDDVIECTFEAVVLAGIDGGRFPRGADADPILNESLRIEINRLLGPRLMQSSATTGRGRIRADARDRWVWQEALASASRHLWITYTAQLGEDEHGRSEFVEELLHARRATPISGSPASASVWSASYHAPGAMLAVQHDDDDDDDAAAPHFTTGLAAWLHAWAWHGVAKRQRGVWNGIEHMLITLAPDACARVMQRADHAFHMQTAQRMPRLPDADGAVIEHAMTHALQSPSHLNTLGLCGYRYFANALLALRREQVPTLGADTRDQGNLAHAALDFIYRALLRDAGVHDSMPFSEVYNHRAFATARQHPEATLQRARALLDNFRSDLLRQAHIHPLLHDAIIDDVWHVVHTQLRKDLAADAVHEPLAFEHAFGDADRMDGDGRMHRSTPPLLVPDPHSDRSIVIRGKIDRIDGLPKQLHALDYKRTAPKVVAGRHFQLPIYAAVAARDAQPVGDRADPALLPFEHIDGAWIILASAERKYPPRDAHTPDVPMVQLQKQLWPRIDRVVAGDVSPDPAMPTHDCVWCDYRNLCRVPGTDPT